MTMRTQASRTAHAARRAAERRGNVLVLVAGILVLLVIVGASYLSRTRAERVAAGAVRSVSFDDNRHRVIGDDIARQISEALFPRPVNPLATNPFDPNVPRLGIEPFAARFGIDRDANGDGVPDYPWNAVPYHTYPWTNWPDAMVDLANNTAPRMDDLPGNPGTNDARWLSSTEPERRLFPAPNTVGFGGADGNPDTPDHVEHFTHWLHMANPMRPDNGWVFVPDIANIEFSANAFISGSAPYATQFGPWGTPIEQWNSATRPNSLAPLLPITFNTARGKNYYPGDANWQLLWANWLRFYDFTARDMRPPGIPGNYFRLADCYFGGQDLAHEIGERPQDEFAGPGVLAGFPNGAPRYNISRILADADGDGWTDSYWFLAPASGNDDLRTLVAMRVVDASSMLNLNVATQFVRRDDASLNPVQVGTKGHTPADLALFEHRFDTISGVGFLNNPENSESVFPDGGLANGDVRSPWGNKQVVFQGVARWEGGVFTVLGETGLSSTILRNPYGRMDYWRRAGLNPYDPALPSGLFTASFTPWSVADELELRMYHASNTPWVGTRLEKTLTNEVIDTTNQIIRASLAAEESSEYIDQLDVREVGAPGSGIFFDEMLHDNRHRLTTYSGARNETSPPWMWWEYRWTNPNLGPPPALSNFLAQQRLKLDLREPLINPLTLPAGAFVMPRRLPWLLYTALTEGPGLSNPPAGPAAYYDDFNNVLNFDAAETSPNRHAASARLAAGLAANMLQWRDADIAYVSLEDDAVRVPLVAGNGVANDFGTYHSTHRFLGMEMQPFLVEAFVAHVYEWRGRTAATAHPGGLNGPIAPGNRVIGSNSNQHTIVVVQIGNPYERRLPLEDFIIRVYGQDFPLSLDPNLYLEPGETRTYWSIGRDVAGFKDALDIEDALLPRAFVEVPTQWSRTRAVYDAGNVERAVEIFRRVTNVGNNNARVLIDRMDIRAEAADPFRDFGFGESIRDLGTSTLRPTDLDTVEPLPGVQWNVLVVQSNENRWIQYARASRDMDRDINGNGLKDDDEKNPRYVFAVREVRTEQDGYFFDTSATAHDWLIRNSSKITRFLPLDPNTGAALIAVNNNYANNPNVVWDKNVNLNEGTGVDEFIDLDFAMQMLQKDGDFEQVGEILNVFTYGHLLRFTNGLNTLDTSGADAGTIKTFSEFMIDGKLTGMDRRVNRLRLEPTLVTFWDQQIRHSGVVGVGDPNNAGDLRHGFPALPAGVRVFDALVCDAEGFNAYLFDINGNATAGDAEDLELQRFRNAAAYTGRLTAGLININTASREVMRAMPHAYRFLHATNLDDGGVNMPHLDPTVDYGVGRTRFVEAIEAYRDRLGNYVTAGPLDDPLPKYAGRGQRATSNIPNPRLNDTRGERGIVSVGEVGLLREPGRINTGNAVIDARWNQSFSIEYGGMNPLRNPAFPDAVVDMDVSTDAHLVKSFDPNTNVLVLDEVARDMEEANLLHAGISNLITTRSDVFVVYYRVRTVRRDPSTGVWNGLNPEFIVSDKRYVMLVDRSNVNRPSDSPKILFFEEVPN